MSIFRTVLFLLAISNCLFGAQTEFTENTPDVFWAKPSWARDYDDRMVVSVNAAEPFTAEIMILKMDSSCWVSEKKHFPAGTTEVQMSPTDFTQDTRRLIFAGYHKNNNLKPYTVLTFRNVAGVRLEDAADIAGSISDVRFYSSAQADLKSINAECRRLQTRIINRLAFHSDSEAFIASVDSMDVENDSIEKAEGMLDMLQTILGTVTEMEAVSDLQTILKTTGGSEATACSCTNTDLVQAVISGEMPQITADYNELKQDHEKLENLLTSLIGKKLHRGLDDKSFGFFGWRADENGLLINNLGPMFIYRNFQWPDRNGEMFSFNWDFWTGGAGDSQGSALLGNAMTDRSNPTGIGDLGSFSLRYPVQIDHASVSWLNIKLNSEATGPDGTESFTVLAGLAAPGILLQTEKDEICFYKGQNTPSSPDTVLLEINGKVCSFGRDDKHISLAGMTSPWIVFRWIDDPTSTPVLLVPAHRPLSLERLDGKIALKFSGSAEVIGIATPYGILCEKDLQTVSVEQDIHRFNLITKMLFSYPVRCGEYFSSTDRSVDIWDAFQYFHVENDFGIEPFYYAAIPPVLNTTAGHVDKLIEFYGDVQTSNIRTKWGELQYVDQPVLHYSLKTPDIQHSVYPKHQPTDREAKKVEAVFKSWGRIMDRSESTPVYPNFVPHKLTQHDYAQLADCRYMMNDDQWARTLRAWAKGVRGATLPPVLRTRIEPFSGIKYFGTVYYASDFDNRADKLGDLNYWNGLAVYGMWKYRKYSGDLELIQERWTGIKDLFAYMVATGSWADMGSPARESGEMMHADMPPAGFVAYLAMSELSKEIGTDEEREFYTYLLAREYVPILAKFWFLDYINGSLRELAENGNTICTGFGERYVASVPPLRFDPSQCNQSWGRGNIWWYTGMFGPMGPQCEYYNLIYNAASDRIAKFYKVFDQVIPWNEFAAKWYDYVFMPHFMNRLYLAKEDRDIESLAESVVPRSNGGVDPLGAQVYIKLSTLTAGVPIELSNWKNLEVSEFSYADQTASLTVHASADADLTFKSSEMSFSVLFEGQDIGQMVDRLSGNRFRVNFPQEADGELQIVYPHK